MFGINTLKYKVALLEEKVAELETELLLSKSPYKFEMFKQVQYKKPYKVWGEEFQSFLQGIIVKRMVINGVKYYSITDNNGHTTKHVEEQYLTLLSDLHTNIKV